MKKEPIAKKFEVSQKAVLYDKATKKFLLAKYAPPYEPAWSFVGGRLDEGETDLLGSLEREIVEEAGNIRYQVAGPIDAELGERIRLGYLVLYEGGDIVLSAEHSEYAWFTAQEIEDHEDMRPEIKQFVLAAQKRLKEGEYLEDLKRLQADFENYKKRQVESQKELGGYLIEKLLLDIIPVLDNFQMSTNHVPEEDKETPWVMGIRYIEKQLEDALRGHGVEVLPVKEGDRFDPHLHEAIESKEESSEKPGKEEEEETGQDERREVVAKVLQNGYKVGDRVVRPAKVVVSS